MLINKKQYNLNDIIVIFELDKENIPDIVNPQPFEQMKQNLEEFKILLKNQYRKLAKKYHPDHGGNKEDFQVLSNLYNMVIKLEIKPIQRPTIIIHGGYSYYSYSSTSTTTSSYTF